MFMLNNPILLHIIPFDGKFFDDAEQTIFSLVTLNLVVLALFTIALLSIRDQRRAARAETKALRARQKEQPTLQTESPSDPASTSPIEAPTPSNQAGYRRTRKK
jgi:hypothetical protein